MKKIPEIRIPKAVELPGVEKRVLERNGLEVYVIRAQEQEVARVSFVWEAGSAAGYEEGVKPFVATSALNLMAEGTERLTAKEVAEKLDYVGSYYEVSADRDYAVMTFCALGKFLKETLEVMEEVVLRPVYPEEELEVWAKKRMERLAVERTKPAVRAREALSAELFGKDSAYGASAPTEAYREVTREDVVEFRKKYYGAGNCFVVCTLGGGADGRGGEERLFEILEKL